MKSHDFPSVNATYHILTTVADPALRNLRRRNEITNKDLYPNGFPFHQLRAIGLSAFSAGLPTPTKAYGDMYQRWQRRQKEKARREAMKHGNWHGDEENDGVTAVTAGECPYSIICLRISLHLPFERWIATSNQPPRILAGNHPEFYEKGAVIA
jgi:hypothetical protein